MTLILTYFSFAIPLAVDTCDLVFGTQMINDKDIYTLLTSFNTLAFGICVSLEVGGWYLLQGNLSKNNLEFRN